MVQKILLRLKEWWRNNIVDNVPPHLDNLFDNKKDVEMELWECATCGSRSICDNCKISKK